MRFTALHQYLGKNPGPVSDDLLDEAVVAGLSETSDLDWKRELPPAKNAGSSEFPKDVAAMANARGGTIVYGVTEHQKVATGRVDAGELTEIHERALHSAAVTAITPPIFGLRFHRIGEEGNRAVVLVVPASVDGPHLIYRNDYFGAPVRNDADTVWMRERQIEAMYRARFDERRHAAEALDSLYAEAAVGHDLAERAWFVGVAHPRLPVVGGPRPEREQAAALFEQAGQASLRWADRRSGMHPLECVARSAPRPGLRRWIAPNTAVSERQRYRQAWASIHHDSSVTLAAAVGGPPKSFDEGTWPGWCIAAASIECAISDLAGLLPGCDRCSGRQLGV